MKSIHVIDINRYIETLPAEQSAIALQENEQEFLSCSFVDEVEEQILIGEIINLLLHWSDTSERLTRKFLAGKELRDSERRIFKICLRQVREYLDK